MSKEKSFFEKAPSPSDAPPRSEIADKDALILCASLKGTISHIRRCYPLLLGDLDYIEQAANLIKAQSAELAQKEKGAELLRACLFGELNRAEAAEAELARVRADRDAILNSSRRMARFVQDHATDEDWETLGTADSMLKICETKTPYASTWIAEMHARSEKAKAEATALREHARELRAELAQRDAALANDRHD